MSAFTLVTSRRSRQQRRAPLRVNTEYKSPSELIAERGSRDFRRQFPTNHDASGHYAPVAVAPQGAWKSTLKVNHNAVQTAPKQSFRRAVKVAPKKAAAATLTIECSYCHDNHHIRDCERAAYATAKKQAWKRRAKKESAEQRFSRAEERLRQQILAAQMAKKLEQQTVVEENSDSSDSDSEEEEEEIHTVDNSEKIADLEKQIEAKKAEMEGVSWADAADIEDEIEDLEEELAALREN